MSARPRYSLTTIRGLVATSFFLALAVVLPMAFHWAQLAGRAFSPMHVPVLLAGAFLGWFPALVIGALAPVLSFLLIGMPPPYAVPMMAIELPFYGAILAVLYRNLKLPLLVALIVAIIVGRLAFGFSMVFLAPLLGLPHSVKTFLAAAFVTGLPGIAVQLVLIPIAVRTLGPLFRKR